MEMIRRVLLTSRVLPTLELGCLTAFRPSSPLILRHLCTASNGRGQGRQKVVVTLQDEDLHESFVKGSGKGGQKINKVRNCVLLKHLPTGLHVRCQKTRSLDDNRRVARKLLLQKLDDHFNGHLSARNVKINKLRKRKANQRARSKQKYAASDGAAEVDEDLDENVEEEEDDEEMHVEADQKINHSV